MASRSSNRSKNGTSNARDDDASTAAGEGSAASEMAGQLKTAASDAASAVGDKAQNMVSGVTDELEHVINERKEEGAERLHSFAEAITRAGSQLQEEFPLVASYVQRGASKLDSFAEVIRQQDGRTLAARAGEVVRRRPGTVAGILGLAGFAAVRFLLAKPLQSGAGNRDLPDGGEGTHEAVQQALERLESSDDVATGDPDGVAPVAPGFETTSTDTRDAESRPS